MKKTLALLLALLMITTIALAACKKEKTPSSYPRPYAQISKKPL